LKNVINPCSLIQVILQAIQDRGESAASAGPGRAAPTGISGAPRVRDRVARTGPSLCVALPPSLPPFLPPSLPLSLTAPRAEEVVTCVPEQHPPSPAHRSSNGLRR
jgi:hypothetical protein